MRFWRKSQSNRQWKMHIKYLNIVLQDLKTRNLRTTLSKFCWPYDLNSRLIPDKDDIFQTSRVSKFFAEQTFKAIILKISDNYSNVLTNGSLNQSCRQLRVSSSHLIKQSQYLDGFSWHSSKVCELHSSFLFKAI